MDWRIYHAINVFTNQHHWLGSIFRFIETYGTYAIGIAAACLWLASRPGGSRKWKFAAGASLASAALALVVNQIISHAWHRDRPFQTHHVAHIFGARKTDASFPSDHASASFGIAVAIMLIDPLVGIAFLVLAVLITVGRVIVGEHYPGDVLAGAAIGSLSALVVVQVAEPVIAFLVRIVERVTDPVLRPVWRR
jgi:membrane-associated phospholipid phosphatase